MVFRCIRDWRRRRYLVHAELDQAAWDWASKKVRCVRRLPPAELAELRRLVLLFLREKDFIAVEGFALEDRHRYAIAIQACVVILHFGIEAYHGWRSIYVFPGTFRSRDNSPGALGDDAHIAGLALQGGGVALAWSEASRGFTDVEDGYNPIIHEFVHKLDMIDGAADGRPDLPPGVSQGEWGQTFGTAFTEFCATLERGGRSRLSDYAATNPAEFFAVLSEVYFEEPAILAAEYPAALRLLTAFFRQTAAAPV